MSIETFAVSEFGANAYVFPIDSKKFCVIDAGGNGDEIAENVKSRGGEISAALFTHGHFDHTAGLTAILRHFPDAKVFASKEDSKFFGENSLAENVAEFGALGLSQFVDKTVFPLKKADFLLSDGQVVFERSLEFPRGLKVIGLAGHTKGSVGFYSAEKSCLFGGDTIFALGSCGRTDGLSADFSQIQRSILKVLSLPDDTVIFCGHGAATTVASEKKFWKIF